VTRRGTQLAGQKNGEGLTKKQKAAGEGEERTGGGRGLLKKRGRKGNHPHDKKIRGNTSRERKEPGKKKGGGHKQPECTESWGEFSSRSCSSKRGLKRTEIGDKKEWVLEKNFVTCKTRNQSSLQRGWGEGERGRKGKNEAFSRKHKKTNQRKKTEVQKGTRIRCCGDMWEGRLRTSRP